MDTGANVIESEFVNNRFTFHIKHSVDTGANVIEANLEMTVHLSPKTFGGHRSERYRSKFVNNCSLFTQNIRWTMRRQRITRVLPIVGLNVGAIISISLSALLRAEELF